MRPPVDTGQYRQTEYAIHGCSGKQRLERRLAVKIAARMRSVGKRGAHNVSAYRCPACGHWRVGSKPS